MSETAPVCHISPDQVIGQPPGRALPNIPKATDLASALRAINAITYIVNRLSGSFYGGGGGSRTGTSGQLGAGGVRTTASKNKGDKPQDARWAEVSRTTQKVKVYNPKDKEQWVEILRINSLQMRDSVTGEVWYWKRER